MESDPICFLFIFSARPAMFLGALSLISAVTGSSLAFSRAQRTSRQCSFSLDVIRAESMIRDESRRRVLHEDSQVLVRQANSGSRGEIVQTHHGMTVGILRDDTEQRPQTGAYWSKLFRAGLLVMK